MEHGGVWLAMSERPKPMNISPLSYASRMLRSALPDAPEDPARPPLVDGARLFGHMRRLQDDALQLMCEVSREYGPIARLQLGPITAHLVTAPELVREVLLTRRENFSKDTRGFRKLSFLLGEGLLTSGGELWRRQRRTMQPVFRRARVGVFADAMVGRTRELLDSWEADLDSGRPHEIADEMMALTLRIVGDTLLGANFDGDIEEVGEAVYELMEAALVRIRMPLDFVEGLPLPQNTRIERRCAELDAIVNRVITRRLEHPEEGGDDLLGMLLEARDAETGAQMDRTQLRDEVMTIFLAGHETTANALTWALVTLSRYPVVARRLEEEVDRVLGDRPATADDLPELVYTGMVIQEVMRLFPPAWNFGRNTEEDTTLGGYQIAKGELVMVCPYALHRSATLWPNPEGFDPERFRPGRVPADADCVYIPFGGGARICIGKHFAMMEMQLVLATLVQRVRVHLLPGHPIEPEPLITLRPRHGVKATLHRRPIEQQH